MTLAEILDNEELRRHEFPVTREKIFLAHAGDCPLPRRVAEAIAGYARQATTGDQEKFVYPGILEKGRKLGAQLLNCQPEEVSFVGPTSLALSFIASGLKLRKGGHLFERIHAKDPFLVVENLAKLHKGSRQYKLVEVD